MLRDVHPMYTIGVLNPLHLISIQKVLLEQSWGNFVARALHMLHPFKKSASHHPFSVLKEIQNSPECWSDHNSELLFGMMMLI